MFSVCAPTFFFFFVWPCFLIFLMAMAEAWADPSGAWLAIKAGGGKSRHRRGQLHEAQRLTTPEAITEQSKKGTFHMWQTGDEGQGLYGDNVEVADCKRHKQRHTGEEGERENDKRPNSKSRLGPNLRKTLSLSWCGICTHFVVASAGLTVHAWIKEHARIPTMCGQGKTPRQLATH